MTAIKFIFKDVLRYLSQVVMTISIAFLLYGMPIKAYASYTKACVNASGQTIPMTNITINTDDASAYPEGTLIGEPYVGYYSPFAFTGQVCSVGSGTSTWAIPPDDSTVAGTYSSPEGSLPVYTFAGADGFGYAMSVADPNRPWQALQQNPPKPLWSINSAVGNGALGVTYKFYLVTTGPLAPGIHVALAENVMFPCLSSSMTTNTRDLCPAVSIPRVIITVKIGGCDINADTPSTVNLTRINANDLPKKGDVGNNVDFTISLKCNAATTVNMTLTDPNGGDAENGVLYSDKGDGLAENVGIQILSAKDGGQTPQTVHLNETFTVGDATEGQYSIPMSARYYRTSDSEIVGGKVSASVVYEISYQ